MLLHLTPTQLPLWNAYRDLQLAPSPWHCIANQLDARQRVQMQLDQDTLELKQSQDRYQAWLKLWSVLTAEQQQALTKRLALTDHQRALQTEATHLFLSQSIQAQLSRLEQLLKLQAGQQPTWRTFSRAELGERVTPMVALSAGGPAHSLPELVNDTVAFAKAGVASSQAVSHAFNLLWGQLGAEQRQVMNQWYGIGACHAPVHESALTRQFNDDRRLDGQDQQKMLKITTAQRAAWQAYADAQLPPAGLLSVCPSKMTDARDRFQQRLERYQRLLQWAQQWYQAASVLWAQLTPTQRQQMLPAYRSPDGQPTAAAQARPAR